LVDVGATPGAFKKITECMKILSRHNILVTSSRSGKSYLINLLSGNADIINPSEAEEMKKGFVPQHPDFTEKGYVVEESEETARYREAYLNFLDEREKDEIQLIFVPTYACNFTCSYCYQSGYNNHHEVLQGMVTDAFFHYVKTAFAHRRKYITLFGGEPLLMGSLHHKAITYFIDRCAGENVPLAVVTNGYHLEEYLSLFLKVPIKEIQATLDGTAAVHNARRRLKDGSPTFGKIIHGIEKALDAGFPVNLRMVADRENIGLLPELSELAIQKGWTRNPLFKTQIGRNYELHYCQDVPEKLMSRLELWEQVYALALQYPWIEEFHKPAFSVARFLAENGELPSPLFDSCPGCKTEWAFDYTGRIYACTATAGKKEEALGTFYPEIRLSEERVSEWEQRDVLNIPECRDCNLQLACGGGCASVARNKTGRMNAPDCRPVKDLLKLGMEYYFRFEGLKI
jgi:uncharacterized protein